MPYYCTVPRCTSMAGKAKNVSFHQFPRDEELARLWNDILKRGKPYTKYSKVCSLHFRPEDYTITSVGKNKGQWRTLRKDAVPSQNLPFEIPSGTQQRRRSSGAWGPTGLSPSVVDPQMQQQMAQAIYIQTMIAMQAANKGTHMPVQNDRTESSHQKLDADTDHRLNIDKLPEQRIQEIPNSNHGIHEHHNQFKKTSFKCEECSKCFKDPDVFILHKRTHKTRSLDLQESPVTIKGQEKENFNTNSEISRQETLRANPILANLLKSDISTRVPEITNNIIDTNNVLSIENQIMTALAANMESYIRNLSSMLSSQVKEAGKPVNKNDDSNSGHDNYEDDQNSDQDDNKHSVDGDNNSNGDNYLQIYKNFAKDRQFDVNRIQYSADNKLPINNCQGSLQDNQNSATDRQFYVKDVSESSDLQKFAHESQNSPEEENSRTKQELLESQGEEPGCDNQDWNESKDSNNLVIDENVL